MFTVVSATFSKHGPIAHILTDRYGNCYHLARGFTCGETSTPTLLNQDNVVTFMYTGNDVIREVIRIDVRRFVSSAFLVLWVYYVWTYLEEILTHDSGSRREPIQGLR